MTAQKSKRRRDVAPCISSREPLQTKSVTVTARCALGCRSVEVLARAVRSAYAYSARSNRLRCVRAYVGLQHGAVGVLVFFEARSVVATAPTEDAARKLLMDCSCAAPEEGAVTNVFACGAAGCSLELEALRDLGWPAHFDGPRARHVLRLSLGKAQLDAYRSGRYTVKAPSEREAAEASACFLGAVGKGRSEDPKDSKGFSGRRP